MLGNENSAFENTTCSRCGGGGHYSFNLMTGSRCFKCGGRGWTFTKRGAEAHRMFSDSLTAPVEALEPGMKVRMHGLGGGSSWNTVASVTKRDQPSLRDGVEIDAYDVAFTDDSRVGGYNGLTAGSPLRVAQDAESKAAKLAAAVAYQDTLTKQGKARAVKS